MTEIYTDGACSGNPGSGAWAALIDSELLISGHMANVTNNQMEMLAVYEAIKVLPYGAEATIYTDSKLVVGWLKYNWKSNTREISHIRVAIRTAEQALDLRLKYVQVKGHGIVRGNQIVDAEAARLARLHRK